MKALLVLGLALLCGCGHERFSTGHGDAGRFLLEKAINLGGRPIATNGLPTISGDWHFVQDEFGVLVELPAASFSFVDSYLRSAFGAPSSQAGDFTIWGVRDIGIAIYFGKARGVTEVSVHPPMSEEQQARAFRQMSDTVRKNTRWSLQNQTARCSS